MKNFHSLLVILALLIACSPLKNQVQDVTTVKESNTDQIPEYVKEMIKELEDYARAKGITAEEMTFDYREGHDRMLTKEEMQAVKDSIDEYAKYKEDPYDAAEHEKFVNLLNEATFAGDTTLVKELKKKYSRYIKESIPDPKGN